MAFRNPTGRANYEPNSWDEGGPRETTDGFRSYPAAVEGPKRRERSETFSDHYSQARQFYVSQTEIERDHIASAFVFELSKVETEAIRARVVSHLLNIDDGLAKKVAEGLRLPDLPAPADAARPTRDDLEPSPALSILLNGPDSFEGRKLGILVTDGASAALVGALSEAADAEGAMVEIIAPQIGGVKLDDGSWLKAGQKIDGGPSVLYDAVAVIASEAGAGLLARESAARDFVSDAFAHRKFLAYAPGSAALLDKAGISGDLDEGCLELVDGQAERFIEMCRALRFWRREPQVSAT